MRLASRPLNVVLNILLGIAWGSVFLGGIGSFLSFYKTHLLYAIASSFIGLIPGLIGVVLIEHIFTAKEMLHELRKQTKLLERLLQRRDSSSLS